MLPHKYLPNYTIEDYNCWEGDWELIDGIPYAMSPSPVRKHQQLAMSLTLQIGNSMKGDKEKCGDCKVFYELDWILSDKTIVRPDILITCDKIDDDFITKPPVLIVEILSPSTGLKDRHLKFEIYEEEGVKYYLIADPNSKTYQVYELESGHYQEKNISSFEIHNNCNIQLNFDEALAELD